MLLSLSRDFLFVFQYIIYQCRYEMGCVKWMPIFPTDEQTMRQRRSRSAECGVRTGRSIYTAPGIAAHPLLTSGANKYTRLIYKRGIAYASISIDLIESRDGRAESNVTPQCISNCAMCSLSRCTLHSVCGILNHCSNDWFTDSAFFWQYSAVKNLSKYLLILGVSTFPKIFWLFL